MTAQIVATTPHAAGDFARGAGGHGCQHGHQVLAHSRVGDGGGCGGAGPAGEAEGPVHDGWAEEPLGHEDPPEGGEAIAEEGAGLRGALQIPDVEEEGKGGPQPAPLDEEDVEDVAFLAEVGGRGGVGRGEV